MADVPVIALDGLFLTDEATFGGTFPVSAKDYLTQIVPNDPISPTSFTVVGLQDSVDIRYLSVDVDVTDILSFKETLKNVIYVTADDTLTLTDDASNTKLHVTDDLGLTDSATFNKSYYAKDTFTLTDIVSFVLDSSPVVEDDLSLIDTAFCVILDLADTCNYAPQGLLDVAPTLGNAILTLTYPRVSPTSTVVLRNPDFNNQESLGLTRINMSTRGGTLILFADTIWPKIKTLSLQISNLDSCNSDVDNLQQFLRDSIGKQIGLLDHENRQWKGYILNPETALVDQDTTGKQIQLQFEGELV